jgi:hypothetical protein
MFFEGSRYANVPDATLTDPAGREVRYKTNRVIGRPDPRRWTHAVTEGERIDHVAHRYYRDSERFWRICDSNRALWPDDLVSEPGTLLRIPEAQR